MTPPIFLRLALILALSAPAAGRVSAQPPGGESGLASETVPEGIAAEVCCDCPR